MIDEEEWRAIPDHDGYEVSSHGRVRSLDRMVDGRGNCLRLVKGRILKAHSIASAPKHSDRYSHVMTGRGRMRRVHQLVAWAFIGPQPKGQYACHDDGDVTNNRSDNIYYGTPRQNQLDRRRHGRLGVGSKHHRAKLTEIDVLKIRAALQAGELQRVVAAQFGVTPSAISEIKTRARWAHV